MIYDRRIIFIQNGIALFIKSVYGGLSNSYIIYIPGIIRVGRVRQEIIGLCMTAEVIEVFSDVRFAVVRSYCYVGYLVAADKADKISIIGELDELTSQDLECSVLIEIYSVCGIKNNIGRQNNVQTCNITVKREIEFI